jgi:hypothetical protein
MEKPYFTTLIEKPSGTIWALKLLVTAAAF